MTPEDVHFYESAPPSPRKKMLALPPPPDVPDESTISLGNWKGKGVAASTLPKSTPSHDPVDPMKDEDPEEGTPEYIRRRFFPDVPADDPSVAWMENATPDPTDSSLRFDLTGSLVPPSLSSTLPTHLGLHHHADGSRAGYTIDDIFLLSRSTVPAQRATMLDVLCRLCRKLSINRRAETGHLIEELSGQEEKLRKRMVAAGVEAMRERGSVGARAVELVWECLVQWDDHFIGIDGVELETEDVKDASASIISSLPLDYILSQSSDVLSLRALPSESLSQILSILYRLAQHSNEIASTILATPNLVPNVMQTFLLCAIPPAESSPLPNPTALDFLNIIALSSRSAASQLLEPSDALLRFVTMLPPSSPYAAPLTTALLTSTLRLYTTLASYGLYSHIATTAAAQFSQVGAYIMSSECQSKRLIAAWTRLLEAWIVCATDPHQTTPGHEILWSQVSGWGWADEVLDLRAKLTANEADWKIWAGLWSAEAAWLEGAKINGIKGGESERARALEEFKGGFEDGTEKAVVLASVSGLDAALNELRSDEQLNAGVNNLACLQGLASHATTLSSVVRLFCAALPSSHESPVTAPPFALPFAQVSALCAKIVSHPIWSVIYSERAPSYAHIFCRPLTSLLSFYIQLSRRTPGVSVDLWMAQAFSVLTTLLPGDEDVALQLVSDVSGLINKDLLASYGWSVPPVIWEKGGMDVIAPFLVHTLSPAEQVRIGPSCMSPQSIKLSTTQRLPSSSSVQRQAGTDFGLPLSRDWMLCAVNHLLKSGDSPVFKKLPSSWDASETEIVRASLLLAKVVQEVLQRYSLTAVSMNRANTIFVCMKIFMLEHEQPQSDSQSEVFRDDIVCRFMEEILAPFTVSKTTSALPSNDTDLEETSKRFLGSTPFFQYYTDFVSLYDAVSFSHPLFARLLLPPTSMRYAPDYRKHLWSDYSHLLKTIRTPVGQVVAADLAEYLRPAERDPQMIMAYLRSLLTGNLVEFVRMVAIHHIACSIWPDLRDGGGEDFAVKLLKAVVHQGRPDIVRDVVLYWQPLEGSSLPPPSCYEQEGQWKRLRLEWLARNGAGTEIESRLSGLLGGP